MKNRTFKQFREFDWGKITNLEKYGDEMTPIINLTNINHFAISIYAGKYDKISPIGDNAWVRSMIQRS